MQLKRMKIKQDNDVEKEDETELHEYSLSERRELTDYEKSLVDISNIESILDTSVERYEKQVNIIRKKQIEQISKDIIIKSPEKLQVPYIGKMADRIFDEAKKAFKNGVKNVNEEIEMQKKLIKSRKQLDDGLEPLDDFQDEEDNEKFLKSKSKADAVSLGNGLIASALFAFYNMDHEGKTNSEISNEIEMALLGLSPNKVRGLADATVNTAYGLGREVGAFQNKKIIQKAIYSAVLDMRACMDCLPKDGVEHELADYDFRAPNPNCHGGMRCRCINIYVLKDDTTNYATKTKFQYQEDVKKANKIQNINGRREDHVKSYK